MGRSTSLNLLATLLLKQPRTPINLLHGKGTLPPHVQLGAQQDPQGLFCKAAFQLDGPQHVLVPGVVPLQVQDFQSPLLSCMQDMQEHVQEGI